MKSQINRRLIGLTGGISTGKSTASKYLEAKYKLPILDADIYARNAVEIGSVALNAIASRYGANILLADGSLNRQELANIIFQILSSNLVKILKSYRKNFHIKF